MNLWDFVVAVFHHWVASMSSVISLALSLWARAKGKDVANRVFFWIAVIACFVACYQAWNQKAAELQTKQAELAAALVARAPILAGEILGVVAATTTLPGDVEKTVVMVFAEISNLGAPTVVDRYEAVITLLAGEKVRCNLLMLPPRILGPIDGTEIPLAYAEDALYQKTATTAIPTNAKAIGVLLFEVPGVDRQTVTTPGTVVTVSFQDVLGRRYQSERKFTGKQDPFRYIPGLRAPVPTSIP